MVRERERERMHTQPKEFLPHPRGIAIFRPFVFGAQFGEEKRKTD